MDNQTPTNVLIDTTTGEIVDKFFANDKLTVKRSTQLSYVDTHILNFNRDKSFVKVFDDIVPLLEKYLTLPEFKFAICLSVHVSYEDCIIRQTKDRMSKILSVKEIAELHNYKYEYARKLMMSLRNKGLIGKHETGSILNNYNGKLHTAYTVNPYVYFRGSDLLTPIHTFYQNSGWRELLENQNNFVEKLAD